MTGLEFAQQKQIRDLTEQIKLLEAELRAWKDAHGAAMNAVENIEKRKR